MRIGQIVLLVSAVVLLLPGRASSQRAIAEGAVLPVPTAQPSMLPESRLAPYARDAVAVAPVARYSVVTLPGVPARDAARPARSRRRVVLTYAAIGGLLGASIGYATIWFADYDDCNECSRQMDGAIRAIPAGLLGVAFGAAYGASVSGNDHDAGVAKR